MDQNCFGFTYANSCISTGSTAGHSGIFLMEKELEKEFTFPLEKENGAAVPFKPKQ